MSLSDAGVVSTLSLESGWWHPILDLKVNMPASAGQLWLVGFLENEMLAIVLPEGFTQPTLKMKTLVKKFKLQVPVLESADHIPAE